MIFNRGPELYDGIIQNNEQKVRDILNSWRCPFWFQVRPVREIYDYPLQKATASLPILRALLTVYKRISADEVGMALQQAALEGNLEAVNLVLDHFNPIISCNDKALAFGYAAKNGYTNIVSMMLVRFNDVLTVEDKNWALRSAATRYHFVAMNTLLNDPVVLSGAHLSSNAALKILIGYAPQYIAESQSIVQKLLKNPQVKVLLSEDPFVQCLVQSVLEFSENSLIFMFKPSNRVCKSDDENSSMLCNVKPRL